MNIVYTQIKFEEDSYYQYRNQFLEFYTDIFSKAPFYEKFTKDEVIGVYDESSKEECIIYCAIDLSCNKIIAFGAGKPVINCDSKMRAIFLNYFPVNQGFYNSDVATDEQYRGKGIGAKLIDLRIEFARNAGYKYSVLRVAKENSMSAPLYLKRGFKKMKEEMLVSQPRVNKNISEQENRIFLWREI